MTLQFVTVIDDCDDSIWRQKTHELAARLTGFLMKKAYSSKTYSYDIRSADGSASDPPEGAFRNIRKFSSPLGFPDFDLPYTLCVQTRRQHSHEHQLRKWISEISADGQFNAANSRIAQRVLRGIDSLSPMVPHKTDMKFFFRQTVRINLTLG